MGKQRLDSGRGRRANVVKSQRRGGSRRPFYVALGLIAVAGVAALAWQMTRPRSMAEIVEATTPGAAEGYLYGDPAAPVQILEFADFECPGCAHFATVSEPDVRKRIVDAGLANFRFFDFPLSQHRNSIPAHLAAACAADQGKFWEMHDRIFMGQPDWAAGPRESDFGASRKAKREFARYARDVGLNTSEWERCYDERRHLERILGNREEGVRRGVGSTPTFFIGRRKVSSVLGVDQLKAYVDTALVEARQQGASGGAGAAPAVGAGGPSSR